MKITPEISELAGLFAADGSMQKNHLCFWGSIYDDQELYDQRVKPIFLDAFGIEVRPHEKRSNSVYGFYVCNKKILKFFNKTLGFPIGSKTYTVVVPEVIKNCNNEDVLIAFVRGFLAGDGCLSFDKRYGSSYRKILTKVHTYPRVILGSVSRGIIDDLSIILKKLKIKHFFNIDRSKKSNESDCYRLFVNGKRRLEIWKSKIGFINPSHNMKYKIFKKYGFVPPYLKYYEKKGILSEDICPWTFYLGVEKQPISK